MPPIPDSHVETIDVLGELGIEAKHIPSDLDPRRHALDQVHCAGHGAQVHPFGCRPALDVLDVALQRLGEVAHRPRAVRASEDPGMDDAAERGPMGRPAIVVRDRARIMSASSV